MPKSLKEFFIQCLVKKSLCLASSTQDSVNPVFVNTKIYFSRWSFYDLVLSFGAVSWLLFVTKVLAKRVACYEGQHWWWPKMRLKCSFMRIFNALLGSMHSVAVQLNASKENIWNNRAKTVVNSITKMLCPIQLDLIFSTFFIRA